MSYKTECQVVWHDVRDREEIEPVINLRFTTYGHPHGDDGMLAKLIPFLQNYLETYDYDEEIMSARFLAENYQAGDCSILEPGSVWSSTRFVYVVDPEKVGVYESDGHLDFDSMEYKFATYFPVPPDCESTLEDLINGNFSDVKVTLRGRGKLEIANFMSYLSHNQPEYMRHVTRLLENIQHVS